MSQAQELMNLGFTPEQIAELAFIPAQIVGVEEAVEMLANLGFTPEQILGFLNPIQAMEQIDEMIEVVGAEAIMIEVVGDSNHSY
jgi:hypothetical protein